MGGAGRGRRVGAGPRSRRVGLLVLDLTWRRGARRAASGDLGCSESWGRAGAIRNWTVWYAMEYNVLVCYDIRHGKYGLIQFGIIRRTGGRRG